MHVAPRGASVWRSEAKRLAPGLAATTAAPPLHRLVNKSDFEQLLAAGSRGRSAHFALHHVPPAAAGQDSAAADSTHRKLSTPHDQQVTRVVDKFRSAPVAELEIRVGWMVPKRHARRAVTRNLVRRQMRAVFEHRRALLAPGSWLLRLRAPFAVTDFPSAASKALTLVVRVELEALLSRTVGPAMR